MTAQEVASYVAALKDKLKGAGQSVKNYGADVLNEMEKPEYGSDELLKRLTGQGSFRDSGRESSGPGEALDSLTAAPVRQALSEGQSGNYDLEAVKRIIGRIGADPQNAPSGFDIASKETDNPYLGTALATAIDVGAQVPIPGMQMPGTPGIIKKLDEPLYHGTFKDFATKDLKSSRGGYVGPGVYMADSPNVAKGYGDSLHTANVKNVKLLDLHDNKFDDAYNAAKELGIADGFNKRMDVKGIGGPKGSTGAFYALQDALIEKIDPDFKLIGNERAQALVDALKEHGYTGIKFLHNDKPAFNIFDPSNLVKTEKRAIKNRKSK